MSISYSSVAVKKPLTKAASGKEGLVQAHSVRTQSTKAWSNQHGGWRQECEVPGRIASPVRKQSETDAGTLLDFSPLSGAAGHGMGLPTFSEHLPVSFNPV